MRHRIHALRLLGLCALVGFSGCFGLNRGAPQQQQYVLGGGSQTASEAAPRVGPGLSVGVRRLELAPYLESNLIAVRRGTQEIRYAEFHQWAEPPEGAINRALAGYLAAAAPFRVVDVAPWPVRQEYDYLVQLHVRQFEGVTANDPAALEGEARLLATWEILRQADGAVLARGTTDYRKAGWRVGDYAGLVTLLDAGVRELSAELTASLQQLAAR